MQHGIESNGQTSKPVMTNMANVYIIHTAPALCESHTCGSSSWKENEILVCADVFPQKFHQSLFCCCIYSTCCLLQAAAVFQLAGGAEQDTNCWKKKRYVASYCCTSTFEGLYRHYTTLQLMCKTCFYF